MNLTFGLHVPSSLQQDVLPVLALVVSHKRVVCICYQCQFPDDMLSTVELFVFQNFLGSAGQGAKTSRNNPMDLLIPRLASTVSE